MRTVVSLGMTSREASLNGRLTGTTSATPGRDSTASAASREVVPKVPIAVRSAPGSGTGVMPNSLIRCTTASISSFVASRFITTSTSGNSKRRIAGQIDGPRWAERPRTVQKYVPRFGGGRDRVEGGAPNDDAVRNAPKSRNVRGRAHAEPDHDRERRVPAHARHEASDVGGERLARARHAGERYAVHEAARERDEPSEAFVAGRRRVQVGPREPLRIERRVELSRLFGRKIGNDDPRDAGLRRIARERGQAARIAKERIRVTHEEHRGVSLPRESTGLGDASGKSGPAPQRDLARALHRRAIRERVAERDAELEHVRTAIERRACQRDGCREVGKADGQVHHDREPLLFARAPKRASDAFRPRHADGHAHSRVPSLITISRSLSPRPERQTTTVCPAPSRAIEGSSAIACAGSSAGMMPSARERSAKASSASRSVRATYRTRPLRASDACSGPTPG